MTTLTHEKVSRGQLKLITRMIGDIADSKPVQDALEALDKEGAERLKRNPEFVESLRQFTVTRIAELSVTDQFKDEETESTYGYLSGYTPKGLTAQCNRLRELFPGIGFANLDMVGAIERGEITLPAHAEGWFAIPNWAKNPSVFGGTYTQALQKVLDEIKKARKGKFQNYREGQIVEARLRQSARTLHALDVLSEAQGNPDILIVPGQFGLRHRGRSVRRAREVFFSNEFGFGAFAIGIMILTHPERLMNYDDLWIDCSGDEFDDPDAGVRFDRAPFFSFSGGGVKFGALWFGNALASFGAASAFIPQQ